MPGDTEFSPESSEFKKMAQITKRLEMPLIGYRTKAPGSVIPVPLIGFMCLWAQIFAPHIFIFVTNKTETSRTSLKGFLGFL